MEMTIQLIFKIAAVGIVVALINQVLKHSGRDDQAYLVSLAGLIIVLTWIIPYVNQLFPSDISRTRSRKIVVFPHPGGDMISVCNNLPSLITYGSRQVAQPLI
jgi:stage III sporulation protein AC